MIKPTKEQLKSFIKDAIKSIDKKIVFIAIVTSAMIIYYINPLINVELTEWDRTFSTSIMAGISISKRIHNFYLLLLIYIPIIFMIITTFYGILFKYRKEYKETFFKISIISLFSLVLSYISRFTETAEFTDNIVYINTMLLFIVTLSIIAIIDKEKMFSDKNIAILFGVFLTGCITINALFTLEKNVDIFIMGAFLIVYSFIFIKIKICQKFFSNSINFLCLSVWFPSLIYLTLEFFYLLNEKGLFIQRYHTNIFRAVIAFFIVIVGLIFCLRKKKLSLYTLGAIGIIVSLSITSYLYHGYQFQYDHGSYYDNYSFFYEVGNGSVAADTVLNGKLPIIDNFSAHALSDVWTTILYALIHSDIKGILVNPYGFLVYIVEFIILYFIIKSFFGEEIALIMICLFPFDIFGIKLLSMYFFPILLIFNLFENKSTKNFFVFWIFTLITAFMRYDEGIYLGISCILSFFILKAINKEWKEIIKFIWTGASVGISALLLYCMYCAITGINIVSRTKEWLAVGLGSNTTWATESFGDPSKFGFLVVYYIFPILALWIFISTIIKYIKKRTDINLVAIILIFAIIQILYVPRTIVFHNFAVAWARTSVLCNFSIYTISFFILYLLILKRESKDRQMVGWISILSILILAVSIGIEGFYPTAIDNVLSVKAERVSRTTNISNDMTDIYGKERITYSEPTEKLVNQFKNVFDELLEKDETFLEFANITAIYMLVDRDRPFYVGQSPSLLTNLYSQECYLEQVQNSKVPLAVVGTRIQEYTTHMWSIPHSVRYYTIAEYIYKNYRPLVKVGDFAIWCEKDLWNKYNQELTNNGFLENGYTLIDYGYDLTFIQRDENGNIVSGVYNPYHQYDLKLIPYIWANYDEYKALENTVIKEINSDTPYTYSFEGSQNLNRDNGNYLAFTVNSEEVEEENVTVIFQDTNEEGAQFEYQFTILPGENSYLIRVSQDCFWEYFNINSILFMPTANFKVDNVRILEGD